MYTTTTVRQVSDPITVRKQEAVKTEPRQDTRQDLASVNDAALMEEIIFDLERSLHSEH